MKKEITLRMFPDTSVGIYLKYDSDKPTKGMRKSLASFLNCKVIPFFGYQFTIQDGKNIPANFKFIKDIQEPFGIVKEYQGILEY